MIRKLSLPPPADLGGPAHMTEWRAGQGHALELMLKDKRRFQVLALPTGIGKTGVNLTAAAYDSDKTHAYLTATRDLQDQVTGDAGTAMGLVDIRGMSNYPCEAEGGTADEASCNDGHPCALKLGGGCSYYDRVKLATGARIKNSNYAFWFSRRANHQDLGPIDTLICDEAHEIASEMERFLEVTLTGKDAVFPPGHHQWDQAAWGKWAQTCVPVVSQRISTTANKWDKKVLRRLREKFKTLASMGSDPNEWVIEQQAGGWSFQPLWPGPYLDHWLWQGCKRVLLSSATITRAMLADLGIKDYHFIEMPSPIPVANRPIYYMPGAGQIKYGADEETLWRWVNLIDRIIEGRLDRKGIIHAVSFDRARYLYENSKWRDLMIEPVRQTSRADIARFKTEDPPCILVSPSVHTGHDFPDDAARYQIIAKVPFLPPSALLKARTLADRSYPYKAALTVLVQMAGRINRSPQDVGETFIVDAMAGWLYRNNRALTPKYFQQAWQEVAEIPRAMRLRA